MRYEALARENGELRGLREALPPVADRWLAAEIVTVQVSGLRQRLLLEPRRQQRRLQGPGGAR